LLLARAFEPQRPVFGLPGDQDLLAQHGFSSANARPLVATAGDAWTVSPPEHVEAFVRADAGWVRAAAPEGKELRLGPGDRLRLASGLFALELSTQPPPSKARGTFVRNLDLRLLAILGAILAALLGMLASLPPHLPARPQEKEAVRYVQAKIEQAKKEPPKPKKEKPKPRPEEAQAVEAQRPEAPLQEARTYKAAATQLKSLDKITKATKGISTLLASLQGPPPTGKKGGSPSGLPLLPTFGAAPSAVLGLGGVGSGGAVGPVTRGSEVLRGGTLGALGGASAGKGGGAVGGLPVSIPKRPAKVQGAIDRDAVGAVVNKHYDEIRGCYERALLGDPNIGPGKVTLEWDIALDGRVSGVRTKVATLKSPDAIRCMLDLIQSLDFPKPQGGLVIVTFPFMFNSVGY
jgi:hypothetical protein